MRSLVLLAFLLAAAPVAITHPYIGGLLWAWLSFMSPHRETFGAAAEAPVVLLAAIGTFVAWIVARRPGPRLMNATTLMIVAFTIWTGITTLVAFDPNYSAPFFYQNAKTFILAIAIIGLISTQTRVQALIWIIAISLGYYAVKGAGFTLLTGGQFRVLGPADTAIGDNNNLGAAFVMVLPLLNYLRLTTRTRLVQWIVVIVMAATVVAVIGTYSRGGLFALAVVGLTMWFRSRHKLVLTLGTVAVFIALPMIVPAKWQERMATITEYSRDESFAGRFQTWLTTLRMVEDRPLVGGGFNATQQPSVYMRYTSDFTTNSRAAHSIYFQVLGDHGIVGFVLYLVLIIVAFVNLSTVVGASKVRPELHAMGDLARMLQVSFIGMLGAGALLSMAYYDAFIVLVALSARLRMLASETAPAAAAATSRWYRSPIANAGATWLRITKTPTERS